MTAPAPVHAQAEPDAIPSITLDSNQPGQLVITWQPPQQAPTDYRIRWTNTNLNWLSWKDDDEAQRANEYPLAGVTTLTLNDLTPGDTYKVQMRSRYYNPDRTARQKSGPWTATATQRVMDNPPAPPTDLTASAVSHNTLTLNWADPQDQNCEEPKPTACRPSNPTRKAKAPRTQTPPWQRKPSTTMRQQP